jgi:hypothetical protein
MSAHIKKKALAKKKKVVARKRRVADARFQKDFRKLQELAANARFIAPPDGVEKMSEVLQDFVKPLMQAAETETSLRKLFAVGIIAWNAAMLGAAECTKLVEDSAKTFPPELHDSFRKDLELLIQRKLEYFADNRREILDFDLNMERGKPKLRVMSTAPEEMMIEG